jgi:hypothetical protein
MKKNIIAFVALSILALPVLALAQMEANAPGGTGATIGSLTQIIHDIENAMGLIFGAIAVICFLTAGILFLTAGGVPEKVQAARSAFLWGIAGVIVGIVAFSIVAIVSSFIS